MVAVFVQEREWGCFRGSNGGAQGVSREHKGVEECKTLHWMWRIMWEPKLIVFSPPSITYFVFQKKGPPVAERSHS